MTHILVITHGNLAKEFVQIAECVTTKKGKAIPIRFDMESNGNNYSSCLKEVVESLDPNEKVIILTDLFGGTPSNEAIPFLKKGRIEVITGLSLPMLVYLMTQPEDAGLEELSKGAQKAAKDGVIIAGEFLK